MYPRVWRARYGGEFETLLQNLPANIRTLANVTCSALSEHVTPTQGAKMDQAPLTFTNVTRRPSAFLPMAMSLTALALVVSYIAADAIETGHIVREADEGAIAHLWQLLMVGQLPILAFFAFKWLGRSPKQAVKVLALQAGGVLANMAVVFFSGLG
jgi:hypothetical protein